MNGRLDGKNFAYLLVRMLTVMIKYGLGQLIVRTFLAVKNNSALSGL